MIPAHLFGGARDGEVFHVPIPVPHTLFISDALDCPLKDGADLTAVDTYELEPVRCWPVAAVTYRLVPQERRRPGA